jgi:midasin
MSKTQSASSYTSYKKQAEAAFRTTCEKKNWRKLVMHWREAARVAVDKLSPRDSPPVSTTMTDEAAATNEGPRKRRKVDPSLLSAWQEFIAETTEFESRHVQKAGKSKFVFSFVEGPLAKAIRNGDWVLLDEVNLASAETLESLSTLLQSPDSSLILTEQGDLEPIPRHPEFRLFACMNPATDVGKRDLPAALRAKFSEIWVPPPDADREALVAIITGYVGRSAAGDLGVIANVADLYTSVKALAISAQLADGSNQPPHYSMRTLARALTFASDFTATFGIRRALYEGFLMSFTMLLEPKSSTTVKSLIEQHIVKGRLSAFTKDPRPPASIDPSQLIKFGSYWLETGPEELQEPSDYILTPSVQSKVLDLARAVLTKKVPVLIQGPTSSGKTSVVEYLAKRTGHRFVRINNHEHTDIQEYIGTYVSDTNSGKLVFQEGVLVRALRRGDWIVLDELNLAPTDVLEALNRLLDDNRELVIPETGEVVRPHPHFMLFATQNPPGLYGGRKVLSRAFRNRFLEMHFGDVPQDELETILCQRCQIAPSYAKKTVAVFLELQRRRQVGRVFEQKHAFATLRDLFRWGGRGSVGYQQLAEDGYMLLAERARRLDDKIVVKEVIEQEMKVVIDESTLYDFSRLVEAGLPEPPTDSELVWTAAMRRLYYLIAAGLHRNEPVLLVGETGSGKTSVCQSLAIALGRQLHIIGCHQSTETADLLGGQRPLRNRAALQSVLRHEAFDLLHSIGQPRPLETDDFEELIFTIDSLIKSLPKSTDSNELSNLAERMRKTTALFEWHDGPLVQAMHSGDLILLDEISLADDSVLERLNSVLEPSRTLVLAEKGGRDLDDIKVVGATGFQILATMNPGGDFGKKELSPALRNRFTEIWVPLVDDREDLLHIISSRWQHSSLEVFGSKILDFGIWFGEAVGMKGGLGIGLRDILAWVDFLNIALSRLS